MGQIERFEDIIAWQRSKDMCMKVYQKLSLCKDFAFRDQAQRCAVSIMNNIAEGFERKGNKEFRKFLYIAKGSSAELRSMMYLAGELRYLSSSESRQIIKDAEEISKILSGFIKKIS